MTLSEFFIIWDKESESTQRILNALTDDSLNQTVTANDRTLGRIAWHIITTIPEMLSRTGLVLESIKENAPVPNNVKIIVDSYREANKAMVTAITNKWNDQTLLEERDMYGQTWTIGATLDALIAHQIHHRGQMTVLMRQAGLKVPGVMGPSREEWNQLGMQAPLV